MWHHLSKRLGWVALAASLATACESTTGQPSLQLLGVEPRVVSLAQDTAVRVTGTGFLIDLRASLVSGEVAADDTFALSLEGSGAASELRDVQWVSQSELSATVPAGLATGLYALLGVGPRGHTDRLEDALEVVMPECANDAACARVDPCTTAHRCVAQICTFDAVAKDSDADGFVDSLCGGPDCDDDPATGGAIHPNAMEVIADGVDQDCDGGDACYEDRDGDGFGRATIVNDTDLDCDNASALTSSVNTDCDDDPAACGSSCFPANPAADDCDGRNQDCDGALDEDFSPTATSCGQGACAGNTGMLTCAMGMTSDSCDPLAGATDDDDCDGVDDDCDGSADDDYVASMTMCGVGACAGNTGMLTCAMGMTSDSCDPLAGATADDNCDGVDDDCDGPADDDYVASMTMCGVGACAGNTGMLTCAMGVVSDSCDKFLGALTEGPFGDPTCSDMIDNDCDALTDAMESICTGANTPPLALAVVLPGLGDPSTTFTADGRGSSDLEDLATSLIYRWDWDGDGSYDDTGAMAAHVYGTVGTFTVVLEVEDTGGLRDHAVFTVVVANASDVLTVTTGVDEQDMNATPPFPGGTGFSLREAVAFAGVLAGTQGILIPSGTVVTLTSSLQLATSMNLVGDGAVVDGGGAGIQCLTHGPDSVIYGLEVRNCTDGINITSTNDNTTVVRCHIHDNDVGIRAVGTNITVGPDNLIEQNAVAGILTNDLVTIVANSIRDNPADGIRVAVGSSGTRIRSNVISGNGTGLNLLTQADGLSILNNTLHGNGGSAITMVSNVDSTDFRNNIMSNNGGWGIDGNAGQFTLRDYNDFYMNGGGDCSGCTPATNSLTDPPFYYDPAVHDFRLRDSSTLLGKGTDVMLDLNGPAPGNFSPPSPEIGAWEAP